MISLVARRDPSTASAVKAMAISADKAADMRAKHLELLQVVIARMANYGATLKNYCITLTTAVCGFATTLGKPWAGLLALLPILICAYLDARYLCNERRFRGLYDKIRQEDWSERPSFDISLSTAPTEPYVSCLFRWAILGFYGPLAFAVLAVTIFAGVTYGR